MTLPSRIKSISQGELPISYVDKVIEFLPQFLKLPDVSKTHLLMQGDTAWIRLGNAGD
jgi:hypothetical protein